MTPASLRTTATIFLFLNLVTGCAVHKPFFRPAEFATPSANDAQNPPDLKSAERLYAQAIQLEQQASPDCIELYFECARELWPHVAQHDVRDGSNRVTELYESSLGRLLTAAQRWDRFDAAEGIQIGEQRLPIVYHQMLFNPSELDHFTPVGEYNAGKDIRPKRQSGLGLPLVIRQSNKRPFVMPQSVLSATAVLRADNASETRLEIFNPLLKRTLKLANQSLPLQFDLTAMMALLSTQHDKAWLTGFLNPYQASESPKQGLHMVTPYQAGKIPIVFVHGLASDPMTWAALANELLGFEDLLQQYQFWIFAYPTGKPFPSEAARLRKQLRDLRQEIDPQHLDPALDQIVLIGHSMGGLVSKLQIANSGNDLVRAVFAKPIDELALPDETKNQIRETFLFRASSQIRRVIFIGTPHRGSQIASNPLGRIGSKLVHQPTSVTREFAQLLDSDSTVFVNRISRVPTSIDLLRPGNRMLEAIFSLPVKQDVALHSIIGAAHGGSFGREQSDGVVPVSSARHPGVRSELLVDSGHGLHHHHDTIAEVVRILRLHETRSAADVRLRH